MTKKYGVFYHREFEIPSECVADCSAQGRNDAAVEYWQPKIALNYWTRSEKIIGLKEYGAWSKEELDAMTDDELECKILWIVCHDIKENEYPASGGEE